MSCDKVNPHSFAGTFRSKSNSLDFLEYWFFPISPRKETQFIERTDRIQKLARMRSKSSNGAAAATATAAGAGSSASAPLSETYPVNSILELTLSPGDEKVQGLVYCTDQISNSIVLKKSLNYTTLASEIRVVNASCVKSKKVIAAEAPQNRNGDSNEEEVQEVAMPLPNVTKKSIDEREKRAVMLAEESFKHINQKVRKCFIKNAGGLALDLTLHARTFSSLVIHVSHIITFYHCAL